ncbi:MAG: hypothetical protein CMH49_04970 [Myxococcales bacterium]|nr:hypothetical protein [Myxococcales bacterium]
MMRLLNEAIKECLALASSALIENRSLDQCYGQYIAKDIIAQSALPLWSQSAMDGYAVRYHEAQEGQTLKVGEIIPAGHWPQKPLAIGEAARIFTGAPLPDGADSVIIQENCKSLPDHQVLIQQSAQKGKHIRQAGEEIALGEMIAQMGQKLTPGLIGLCAAQGFDKLPIFAKAKVCIIETGSELKSPGQKLSGAEIYATNALTLTPLISQSSAILSQVSRTEDSVQALVECIETILDSDTKVILTTGGVSVGDYDPVHEALAKLGAERHFWKVKMKPGKPISVASIKRNQGQDCLLIGLPGNPVSCVVAYLLFVHPLLQKLAGVPEHKCGLRRVQAVLTHEQNKQHQRAELLRVSLSPSSSKSTSTPYLCRLSGGQSSAWISSIAKADGLLYVPDQPCHWPKGHIVEVALFPWTQLEKVDSKFG